MLRDNQTFAYNYFAAAIVDNLFDNPVIFKNFQNYFSLISSRIDVIKVKYRCK